VERGLSRRQFLKVTAAGTALLAAGLSLEDCADGAAPVRFFAAHDRDTLAAAAARILPTDQDAGVADYIERLLTAFDHDPPRIFAGGPFSGRLPYPDYTNGRPSRDIPVAAFERFLPLTRVQEIAWRVRIFGSQDVPGGSYNDAVLGPVKGWRPLYQEGLSSLDAKGHELFGKSFVALGPDDQDNALAAADQAFVSTLTEHTVEAVFAAPEYGGNRDLLGWKSMRFEGDSQPLGYSIYDASSHSYRERADHPLSTANPDEDFKGFDQQVFEFVNTIATGQGGKRFF
jgi:hypothetical protein